MCYTRLLERRGYEAASAFDGAQVVNEVTSSKPDLVVLDRSISRIDSEKLISFLNENNVPFVLMTDKKPAGNVTYILYPFAPEDLYKKISEVTVNG